MTTPSTATSPTVQAPPAVPAPGPAARVAATMHRHLALLAGFAGLAVALATALGPWRGGPPSPAADTGIASVDGRAISRATYERAIAALEADKRNTITSTDRRLALSRLIDEELLVRRGIDLGLVEAEPTVRKALVDAMLQLASMPPLEGEPDETELRRFYAGRPTLLAAEPLLTLELARFPAEQRPRAERLASLLRAGAAFDTAAAETSAERPSAPPALSSVRKLTDYVGPTVSAAVARLEPGESVGPIEAGGSLVFAVVRERHAADRPSFDSARAEILEAWRRTARDRGLEKYLAELRARSQIVLAPDAPR